MLGRRAAAACAAVAGLVAGANLGSMNQAVAKITAVQQVVAYPFPPAPVAPYPAVTPVFRPLYAMNVPGTDFLAVAGKDGFVDFLDLNTVNSPPGSPHGSPPVSPVSTPVLRLPTETYENEFLFVDNFGDNPPLHLRNDSGIHGLAFHPDFSTVGAPGYRKFYVNATFDNSVVAGSPFLDLVGKPTGSGPFNPSDSYSAAELSLINTTLSNPANSALVNQLFWPEPGFVNPPQASLDINNKLVFRSPSGVVGDPTTKPALFNHPGYVEVREYTFTPGAPVNPNSYDLVLRYQMNFELHNGGWMDFGPDGYLYMTTGDSTGNPVNQLTSPDDPSDDWHGKILRVDVNGDDYPADATRNYVVPDDNPFANGNDTAKAVWAYGMRHPFRASFDSETGDLWIGDVGFGNSSGVGTFSRGVEEVNFMAAGEGGANFGWPYFEGTYPFAADIPPPNGMGPAPLPDEAYTDPVYAYEHTLAIPGPEVRKQITGGFVYRGSDPDLYGKYLFFESNQRELWMFDPVDPQGTVTNISSMVMMTDPMGVKRWLSNGQPVTLVASFGQDSTGSLYLVDLPTNRVYRLITSGDFNSDGIVDNVDVDLLAAADRANSTNLLYDLDGDGMVTYSLSVDGVSSDSDYLVREILDTEYGDSNLDGAVDLLDFDLFGQGYSGGGVGWLFGDYDGSGGATSLLDFDHFGRFYGYPSEPSPALSVPEASTAALLGLACMGFLIVHPKRKSRR